MEQTMEESKLYYEEREIGQSWGKASISIALKENSMTGMSLDGNLSLSLLGSLISAS
jgi:hypothetical protein